jgi:uncharacterized membrane-anchored protein YjiN (DUF445 family)
MQAVALALLVGAAVVFVWSHGREGVWGYVNAGAEASMVGAIADWFAVTALFRHPLGLPIPHTALIPRRKNDLGQGLQGFVAENFMQPEIVRDRVLAAEMSSRVGAWLGEPAHAGRIVSEGSEIVATALTKIREDHVRDLVELALVPRFRAEPIAPVLGSTLSEVLRDDLHRSLVDLALEEMHRWLVGNHETFTRVLGERAPWWSPPRVNDAVTNKVHAEAIRWVEDIQREPHHHARKALDSMLVQLADDLLHDPATADRAERFKNRLLDHPQLSETAISLWQALRNALLGSLDDPEGAVRHWLLAEIDAFADRLQVDADLRTRLDTAAADAVVFLVGRYGSEVTGIITHTIDRWDGAEAARKIELHVGRDLQFIRINGTLVGGMVGLVIHAVASLLG